MANTPADAGTPSTSTTWLKTLTVYGTPVMLSMLVLGFASGLPLYMVFQKLSYWLRDAGIDRSTIGFFYFVTLSYTLKFLWAPLVDRVKIPFLNKLLGARRSWIFTAIAGTVIALVLIAFSDPTGASYRRDETGTRFAEISLEEYAVLSDSLQLAVDSENERVSVEEAAQLREGVRTVSGEDGAEIVLVPAEDYRRLLEIVQSDDHFERLAEMRTLWSLFPVVIAALLLAYSGATLDVSIDAWRIESAPNDMQANMAAAYSFGYRIAYMTSGLGLAISEWANWNLSFLTMAAAMALSAALVFLMKEPKAGVGKRELEGSFGLKVVRAVWEPFKAFFDRLGWWIIVVIALISLYRISDFTMGVMAAPLQNRGFAPPLFVSRDAAIVPGEVRTHDVVIGPGCALIAGAASHEGMDLDLYLADDAGREVDRDTAVQSTARVRACRDQPSVMRVAVKGYGRDGAYALALLRAPDSVTSIQALRVEEATAPYRLRGYTPRRRASAWPSRRPETRRRRISISSSAPRTARWWSATRGPTRTRRSRAARRCGRC